MKASPTLSTVSGINLVTEVTAVEWTRPQITDVSIECEEDVLQGCWAASEPLPVEGQCSVPPNGQPCPNFF